MNTLLLLEAIKFLVKMILIFVAGVASIVLGVIGIDKLTDFLDEKGFK